MLKSESELVVAAQGGDLNAFAQLISQLNKKMLSVAAGLASTPDEADDIYQEAMLCAYKALPKFRADSQFSTWLYRILVNSAISSRRKIKNKLSRLISRDQSAYDEHLPTADIEQYAVAQNPEAALMNEQLNRAINHALSRLSEQERIAFVLCHQQEIKIFEAAEVMNCQEGTVKSYLHRAREKMRTQLQGFLD